MIIPYIFFDIDGVLNNESDWRTKRFAINDSCFAVFKSLVDVLTEKYKKRPRLIICSTWRAGFNNREMQDSLATSLLGKKFAEAGLTIDGATPVSTKTRQEEIEYFIRRNGVEKYIVIDDDASLYNDITRINLYVPDYKTGLTKKDLKKMTQQFAKYEE